MTKRYSNLHIQVRFAIAALLLGLATALLAANLGGCSKGGEEAKSPGEPAKTVIQNKGSDTMVNLAQVWAEAYRQVAPDVEVEVSGGGSGVGLAALTRGAVDIANASRDIKPQETEAVKQNTGKMPAEFVVGYDALAIYVHKDNPLEEITLAQIAQIYEEGGTITKWSDLGVTLPSGQDEIIRVSRQSSSGTYEFLREHVLGNRDFKLGSRDLNGSKEVVELVANTPGAIGYSGMGYATNGVKMLKVARAAGEPAVPPSVEATLDKSYPIARSLHLYTVGEPQGAVKAYIDWILGPEGQRLVEESGYVPLTAAQGAK
ncbi:MAG: phosphate ABC transporter substrate-binding protein [Proteobacteria bacterium]|nr:phosphate ABC transporter substrate-binding protein [Pseudomonadota bacterium]